MVSPAADKVSGATHRFFTIHAASSMGRSVLPSGHASRCPPSEGKEGTMLRSPLAIRLALILAALAALAMIAGELPWGPA